MRQLIPFIFLLLSCSTERDIVITPISTNREIIIFPSFKKDSLEVFIPHSFKVENKAFEEARLNRFRYQPDGHLPENDMLVIDDDGSIKKRLSAKAKFIPSKSSKVYTYYLKTFENKKNIDEKYWKSFPSFQPSYKGRGRGNYIELLSHGFNRVSSESDVYEKLQKKVINDSIAFTFTYGEYFVIKVCKLKEYKFKTITQDDILENPDMEGQSIFKP